MDLRNKIIITIGIAWALFLSLTYAFSKEFLLESYIKLEQQDTIEDLGRIVSSSLFISPIAIKKVETPLQGNLKLLSINDIKKNPHYVSHYKTINTNKTGFTFFPIDEHIILGYAIAKDAQGKAVGMFQKTIPRLIYQTGLKTIHYFLINFLIISITFTALTLWLLRVLINRVARYTAALEATNAQLQKNIYERDKMEKELLNHKEHLLQLAHYDHLTSLPNRVFFNEILNKAIKQAHRYRKQLAVLFIDLDRFKNINDALGHDTGDMVLKETASRFTANLRAGDVIARLGGDEFIVLLNDIEQPKFAGTVADNLIRACKEPMLFNHHELFISASIGICIYPDDSLSLEDLHKHADKAMYQAKKAGGSTYRLFTSEMNTEAHEHIKLESALHKAIANNEFVLHFQPKFDLITGKIVGVEALIRWESPENGMINPATFIPLAEETGLILEIGKWTINEACRINKSWQLQGYEPITMAVNISPRQFQKEDIAATIATALSKSGLDANYLEVEITETAIMQDMNLSIQKLNEIKNMGIQISIDDFGTGYTSINYLKQYPVSILKIDQSFIKGIPLNQNDMTITSAIIALAHNLRMSVIAEGVETAEQLTFLADHQCDMVQGYYLSRPLPEQKLLTQLTQVNTLYKGEHV